MLLFLCFCGRKAVTKVWASLGEAGLVVEVVLQSEKQEMKVVISRVKGTVAKQSKVECGKARN